MTVHLSRLAHKERYHCLDHTNHNSPNLQQSGNFLFWLMFPEHICSGFNALPWQSVWGCGGIFETCVWGEPRSAIPRVIADKDICLIHINPFSIVPPAQRNSRWAVELPRAAAVAKTVNADIDVTPQNMLNKYGTLCIFITHSSPHAEIAHLKRVLEASSAMWHHCESHNQSTLEVD